MRTQRLHWCHSLHVVKVLRSAPALLLPDAACMLDVCFPFSNFIHQMYQVPHVFAVPEFERPSASHTNIHAQRLQASARPLTCCHLQVGKRFISGAHLLQLLLIGRERDDYLRRLLQRLLQVSSLHTPLRLQHYPRFGKHAREQKGQLYELRGTSDWLVSMSTHMKRSASFSRLVMYQASAMLIAAHERVLHNMSSEMTQSIQKND